MTNQIEEKQDELALDLDGSEMGPAAVASIASVALALYYYYVRGEKQRGQFVGLWPSTILAFAAYRRLSEIERLLHGLDD